MIPQKLGRYEILGELGKGAMGVVYLARDPLIGRQLALKTFRLGYSARDKELEQFRARFLREAQSAGILNHPNIVTIHDVVEGEDGAGAFFIAMEYVQGTDLKQLMQRGERLPLEFVIDTVAQIADGLDYAHSKGVVHRDIKPANIILTAKGQVKITDFGIARVDASNLTVEGQLLGTPNYMAPEQIQGKEVDHRSDLFSLGVMLYELITRQKPFQGDNLTVVTHRIVYDAFAPPESLVPGLPPKLRKILDKTLQKDPEDRYQNGAEMARDLRAVLEPEPGAAKATTASPAPASGRQSGSFLIDTGTAIEQERGAKRSGEPRAAPRAVPPPSSGPKAQVARSSFLPPAGRLLAVVLVPLVVALSSGLVAYQLIRDGEAAERPNPELELQRQYLPLVKEGRRLLGDAQPAAALEAFQQALVIVPDNREIRRLRDEANRAVLNIDGIDSEQAYVEARLAAAYEALADKEYAKAIRLAEQILEVDPKHQRAKSLLSEAQDGLERRKRVHGRFDKSPTRIAGTTDPGQASDSGSAQDQSEVGEGTLEIDFFSEISEGTVTIYAGQKQIYKESFRFVEKSGLFSRGRKTSGSLSSSHTLAAGEVSLLVYFYRRGEGTKHQELQGNLPADSTRTLRVRVSKEGHLNVQLE